MFGEPDRCESCGEPLEDPQWLPEGQCNCPECAADYWLIENEQN